MKKTPFRSFGELSQAFPQPVEGAKTPRKMESGTQPSTGKLVEIYENIRATALQILNRNTDNTLTRELAETGERAFESAPDHLSRNDKFHVAVQAMREAHASDSRGPTKFEDTLTVARNGQRARHVLGV